MCKEKLLLTFEKKQIVLRTLVQKGLTFYKFSQNMCFNIVFHSSKTTFQSAHSAEIFSEKPLSVNTLYLYANANCKNKPV